MFYSRHISLIFFVLLMSLVLSGCKVTNITVEQKQEKDSFVKGAVMERFPPVPIYPESQIIESYSSGENYGATAAVDEELEKVVDFYQKTFISLGWESSLLRQTENNYLFDFRSAQYRGTVTVNTAADNKKTAISVVVSPR